MTSDANKLERIREAVEKLGPMNALGVIEMQTFISIVEEIVHEDDYEATMKLVDAEHCKVCGNSGQVWNKSTGEPDTCDFCTVAEEKAKGLTK